MKDEEPKSKNTYEGSEGAYEGSCTVQYGSGRAVIAEASARQILVGGQVGMDS